MFTPVVEKSELIDRAKQSMALGNYDQAIQLYAEVRGEWPDEPIAYLEAGVALRELQRFDKAEALLVTAMERFSNNPWAASQHALIANAKGDWAEAKRRFASVQEKFPEHALGYVGAGIALLNAGKLDEADTCLARAKENFPNDPWAAIHHASVAMRWRRWDEALSRWAEVRKKFPDQVAGYVEAGAALSAAGRSEEAEVLLKAVLEKFPHNERAENLLFTLTPLPTTSAGTPKGLADPLYTTIAAEGGYCWFHRERGLTIGTVTIVGAVAGKRTKGITGGDILVVAFDHQTGQSKTKLLGNIGGADDHNAPGLCWVDDDRILVAWQGHGAETKIYSQILDKELTERSEVVVTDIRAAASYSNVFKLPNLPVALNFHRGVDWNPNYLISHDGGRTFSYGGRLLRWGRPDASDPKFTTVSGDGGRPYVNYTQSGTRIHFAVVEDHPRVYDNSVYHGYVEDFIVYDSFGKMIGPLPREGSLPPYDIKTLTRIFEGDEHNVAWVNDIVAGENNTQAIVFSVQKSGGAVRHRVGIGGEDIRYYYAWFDSAKWITFEIGYAGTSLYAGEDDYSGLISCNPDQPTQVVLAANHCPITNRPLISEADQRIHYEIFIGAVDPRTHSVQYSQVTANSPCDNFRPFFTRKIGAKYNTLVWMSGNYRNYVDYRTRMLSIYLTDKTIASITSERYVGREGTLPQPWPAQAPKPPVVPSGEVKQSTPTNSSIVKLVGTAMPIRMSAGELRLYESFLRCSDHYVEFGSGGSTPIACSLVHKSVISVDSSVEWLGAVKRQCVETKTPLTPTLIYADIGPIGEWGYPTDQKTRNRWPDYYTRLWEIDKSREADLFLVDGRFRVACFLSTLLNCRPYSFILFHDFASRSQYHIVRTVCREIASAEDLTAFQVRDDLDRPEIEALLKQYAYNQG